MSSSSSESGLAEIVAVGVTETGAGVTLTVGATDGVWGAVASGPGGIWLQADRQSAIAQRDVSSDIFIFVLWD
jgi:hypothetical protein